MNKFLFLVGLLVWTTSCASNPTIPATQVENEHVSAIRQVNVTIGQERLSDDAWEGLDELVAFGVDFTEEWNSRVLFLEGGLHYGSDRTSLLNSSGNRVRAEIDLVELSAGLLFELPRDEYWLRPYFGGGASLVFVDAEIEEEDSSNADDATFGAYWKVGVLVPVASDTHVGFEVRGLEVGEVSTGYAEAELDSTRFSLVFGASF